MYLTYDSDGAGTRAALRAMPILRDAGITAKIIRMEPYKDPDEFIKNLGAEAFEERIASARNVFMYLSLIHISEPTSQAEISYAEF